MSRVGLLDQAEKLIGDLGSSQSVLEIQYEGEVSRTADCYTLACNSHINRKCRSKMYSVGSIWLTI